MLSGDLGGDDTTDPNWVVMYTDEIVGPNAYHAVTGSGVDITTVLDGFIITASYASLTPPNYNDLADCVVWGDGLSAGLVRHQIMPFSWNDLDSWFQYVCSFTGKVEL